MLRHVHSSLSLNAFQIVPGCPRVRALNLVGVPEVDAEVLRPAAAEEPDEGEQRHGGRDQPEVHRAKLVVEHGDAQARLPGPVLAILAATSTEGR